MNTPIESPAAPLPCRHLRSKEMYYQTPGQEDDAFASGIHWCLQTHEPTGPDGQPCGKGECCEQRTCYAS